VAVNSVPLKAELRMQVVVWGRDWNIQR